MSERITVEGSGDTVASLALAVKATEYLQLAKLLEENYYSVKLAERNEERCLYLADVLNNTLVLRGDGTDKFFLKEERNFSIRCLHRINTM